MQSALGQREYGVRFEWGVAGLHATARDCDDIVVIDTLSFSTAVDVAVSRGAQVFPFRWKDERAGQFAAGMGAKLAVDRREVSVANPFSLSPRSLMGISAGTRLVLPSPNG